MQNRVKIHEPKHGRKRKARIPRNCRRGNTSLLFICLFFYIPPLSPGENERGSLSVVTDYLLITWESRERKNRLLGRRNFRRRCFHTQPISCQSQSVGLSPTFFSVTATKTLFPVQSREVKPRVHILHFHGNGREAGN